MEVELPAAQAIFRLLLLSIVSVKNLIFLTTRKLQQNETEGFYHSFARLLSPPLHQQMLLLSLRKKTPTRLHPSLPAAVI